MRIYTSIALVFLCSLTFAQQIELQTFATGFNSPISIKNAGDSRLFVLEQAGQIQILNSNGNVNSTPYLNISSVVTSGGERGLLGLAFHPDYESNGYFYVNYTSGNNTIISRFTRNTNSADTANQNSELQLLSFSQPYTNHNGGDMAFGPDGYLYISSGDGGDGGDPGNRAQSLNTLIGKLLRIDVDGISEGNYGIPTNNPYAGSTSAMEEIWAYGLRNPWKFSFDRSTGDLWIADVGQDIIEEINSVSSTEAGLNYGWRCYEGNATYNTTGCPSNSTLTFPVAQYTHFDDGAFKCSITGGYRYRGTLFPNFEGLYFFADYCSDEIGVLTPSGTDWNMYFTQSYEDNGWSTFGEDINGELYIAGLKSGTIYKITDSELGVNENNSFSVKLFPNPANDEMTLDSSHSARLLQSVNIFNIQGNLIFTIADLNRQTVSISTKELSDGMYFIEITNTEGHRAIKKLIKK